MDKISKGVDGMKRKLELIKAWLSWKYHTIAYYYFVLRLYWVKLKIKAIENVMKNRDEVK